MRCTGVLIASLLLVYACGGEEPPVEEIIPDDPVSYGQVLDGQYMLMSLVTDQGAGSKSLAFSGLLRFKYSLKGQEAKGTRYREEVFGTLKMGNDVYDCASIQVNTLLVSPEGEVLESKEDRNGCKASGLLSKKATKMVLRLRTQSNELERQVIMGSESMVFRASIMSIN